MTLVSRQAGETVPLSNTVSLIGRYPRGEEIKIKMQVFGVNPTIIRAKVWRAAEVEPQAWSWRRRTDSTGCSAVGWSGSQRRVPVVLSIPLRLSVLDFVTRPVIG